MNEKLAAAKNFVRNHAFEIVTVVATTALAVVVVNHQIKKQNELDEFLTEHNLLEEYYSPAQIEA